MKRVNVGARASQEAVILQRAKVFTGVSLTANTFKFVAFIYPLIYLFCLAAVHSLDLNRCSPSASQYLRHPPIICFTSLPTPPSPLLASPPISNLDHPSAAQDCVSTDGASHWSYIINAGLTAAKPYLFMYLHRSISLKISNYTKAATLQIKTHVIQLLIFS